MHFDKLLGDVKPQAGPAELLRDRLTPLRDLGKNILQLFVGYADPSIRPVIEQIVPLPLYQNRYAPAFAEFQRVSHQVHKTLSDSPTVPEGERDVVLGRSI